MKNNLNVIIAQKRISVNELATKTGLSKNTISQIKNDRKKALKLDTLEKLCKALNCDVGDILLKEGV